ncbi:MAG: hypothetical protein U1E06_25010 [Tabrizicola sp.]|nr:hypothetical protein [Tabrizicola sp.]
MEMLPGQFHSHMHDQDPAHRAACRDLCQTAREALVLSPDTVAELWKRISDVDETQHTMVISPIVAELDGAVARIDEMIHPHESVTAAARSLLIIRT